MALMATRERPTDPIELVLAEVWAVRNTVLNLFHTGAQATVKGKPLLPESVTIIRDRADARKLNEAHRMLAEFRARPAEGRSEEGGEVR